MKVATPLKGVSSERRYSPGLFPSRIFSWNQEPWPAAAAALVMALLLSGRVPALPRHPLLAVRESVDPHEQRRPQGHDEGRYAQGAPDQLRVRGVGDRHLHVQARDVDVRDVEPVRPPGLVLAVDVVHVAVRVPVDAPLRLLEERAALAEGERAAGADRGAGRRLSLRLARGAEGALLHRGDGLGVLVLGDLEGAGHQAVAAAHAALRVVGDRAAGELVEGPHRAGRG